MSRSWIGAGTNGVVRLAALAGVALWVRGVCYSGEIDAARIIKLAQIAQTGSLVSFECKYRVCQRYSEPALHEFRDSVRRRIESRPGGAGLSGIAEKEDAFYRTLLDRKEWINECACEYSRDGEKFRFVQKMRNGKDEERTVRYVNNGKVRIIVVDHDRYAVIDTGNPSAPQSEFGVWEAAAQQFAKKYVWEWLQRCKDVSAERTSDGDGVKVTGKWSTEGVRFVEEGGQQRPQPAILHKEMRCTFDAKDMLPSRVEEYASGDGKNWVLVKDKVFTYGEIGGQRVPTKTEYNVFFCDEMASGKSRDDRVVKESIVYQMEDASFSFTPDPARFDVALPGDFEVVDDQLTGERFFRGPTQEGLDSAVDKALHGAAPGGPGRPND